MACGPLARSWISLASIRHGTVAIPVAEKALYVVGAIACAALALSVRASFSAPKTAPAPATPTASCVDPEARALAESVQRTLIAQSMNPARVAVAAPGASSGSAAAAAPTRDPSITDAGWRKYVRFEVANPSVKVTQRDDGVFDVKTTDPALRGSVVSMQAFTKTGESDQIFVRVPP